MYFPIRGSCIVWFSFRVRFAFCSVLRLSSSKTPIKSQYAIPFAFASQHHAAMTPARTLILIMVIPFQLFRKSNLPETTAYHTRGGTRLRVGLKIFS